MSLRSLEAEILADLRRETGITALRQKDIMEWRTEEIEAQAGETLIKLKSGIYVAYKLRKGKR